MDHVEGNRNLRLSSDSLLSAVHSPAIDLATRQSNYLVKQENSVHIPWRTLLDFGQNSLVRFALIIYKQIDQFIQPNYELFSAIQAGQQTPARLQINSDLVGLLLTNEPFLQIPGTVFITFKHKANLTSTANSAQLHPQTQYCALWNYGLKQWQTDGCQLIESNRTHSTCECNHLSVYALLKSVADDDQKTRDQPSLINSPSERPTESGENLLTIAGYQWAFYTNQLKALVAASCYLSIACLAFVLVSLAFVQYRESKANRLLNKKSSINGTLTDLSLNIHYGTYHSSANNSMTYGSTANKPINSTNDKRSAVQSTFCTHLNLCFVLVLIELLLVFSSKSLPTKLDYENRLNCAIFAALLHYLLLSLFVWLLFDVLLLHSAVRRHLAALNLAKSTDYSLPTISSLAAPNLSARQPKGSISNKWLIAIAYGSCSLLLLVSVLIDAQSYGSALAAGHCFLSNSGPSYLYLLVLPIFVLIVCITLASLSTIKSMAKTRYPLSLNPIKSGDLNNSSASIVLAGQSGNLFTANSLLCKQLKESIVTVIIVSLTWSAALIYLNAAEKVTANSPVGSRSYQLFGILFSVLNIAQAAFFVLYYCLLDSAVRNGYRLAFIQFKRSLNSSFVAVRRKDKVVASSLSANTINTTISAAPSLLTAPNPHKQQGDLVKTASQMIDQLAGQQPIIPPPTTISGSNPNHHTMNANFYLNNNLNNMNNMGNNLNNSAATMAAGQKLNDEPEKCSIDYGFPGAVSLMNSNNMSNLNNLNNLKNLNNLNRNAFHRNTSALHSYQIANSLNCSQAYTGKPEQPIVEHVYESIDGENPYIAKLLSNYQTLGSHAHFHHQLSHLAKTLRPVSSVVQQQQLSNIYHQPPITSMAGSHGHLRSLSDLSNISERPLLSTKNGGHSLAAAGAGLPAIIRDNTKSSTILPNSFQQQHKMKKFSNGDHHFNTHHSSAHNSHLNSQQLNAQQLLKESTLI